VGKYFVQNAMGELELGIGLGTNVPAGIDKYYISQLNLY
jgi:hypothetical protein